MLARCPSLPLSSGGRRSPHAAESPCRSGGSSPDRGGEEGPREQAGWAARAAPTEEWFRGSWRLMVGVSRTPAPGRVWKKQSRWFCRAQLEKAAGWWEAGKRGGPLFAQPVRETASGLLAAASGCQNNLGRKLEPWTESELCHYTCRSEVLALSENKLGQGS